MTVAESYQ